MVSRKVFYSFIVSLPHISNSTEKVIGTVSESNESVGAEENCLCSVCRLSELGKYNSSHTRLTEETIISFVSVVSNIDLVYDMSSERTINVFHVKKQCLVIFLSNDYLSMLCCILFG